MKSKTGTSGLPYNSKDIMPYPSKEFLSRRSIFQTYHELRKRDVNQISTTEGASNEGAEVLDGDSHAAKHVDAGTPSTNDAGIANSVTAECIFRLRFIFFK